MNSRKVLPRFGTFYMYLCAITQKQEKYNGTCKYCGKQFPSIMVMVGGQCVNHPKGSNKGSHAPAL